jgi:two-component system response regulator (stage 0 sporulation protein A)
MEVGKILEPVKIGIVDDNKIFCQLLQEFFDSFVDLEAVTLAYNGVDAMTALSTSNIDVLLLDLIMPQLDGFGVLQWLQKQPFKVKTIVFSAFAQEHLAKKAIELGADYFVMKPFDLQVLAQRIVEIAQTDKRQIITQILPIRDLETEVDNILNRLQVPAHFKGFNYLKSAILMTIKEPNLVNEMTKKLYPLIAELNGINIQRVERSMRFAIESAWNKGDVEILHELFGYCVDDRKGKPTNASFIAKISDKIRLEKKVKGHLTG